MSLLSLNIVAQRPTVTNLYQGSAPYENGDTAKIHIYKARQGKATGRAIVICPGGGYTHLAMDHEGRDWAAVFNSMGITAVVLKYRMPKGDCRVPIADAENAIRYVRNNAAAWNVNPNDIGIMGSSAGGHLASTIATHSEGDAKPNFQILFYPVVTMDLTFTHKGSHDNLLGKNPTKEAEQKYSNEKQVTSSTPRAWIALSHDDTAVPAANGVSYYMELLKNKVPASLHVYPSGGHGWGIRTNFDYHNEMMLELKSWLRSF